MLRSNIGSRSVSRAFSGLSRNFRRHFSAAQTDRKLEGKVAVITGAARGIGKETAAKFIDNGAKVVIADFDKQLGHETASSLGPNAAFIPCDVTKESDVSDAVDYAVAEHGRLDIMYNNAGIPCRTPPSVTDLDLAVFDRVIAVNVRGVVAGIKHASRVMIPQQSGCILCTASVTGMMGGMAQFTYSVSKSAIIGTVRSAAAELSKHGIRVNCISPFAIPTNFTVGELKDHFPDKDREELTAWVSSLGELKGASCESADIANAAVFLASGEAKYVNGHNLVVDGGFTAYKTIAI